MDFAFTQRVEELRANALDFMTTHVHPAEPVAQDQILRSGDPNHFPEVLEELKTEARRRGLWNLFHPDPAFGAGLTNLEYAPIAEITGHSPYLAPQAMNCSAPDTGNMEVLSRFGTPEQQETWLKPLLDGTMRSAFAMTEPEVASSDATNIRTSIEPAGDDYLINGRKWWTSGIGDRRCRIMIVMGRTNPDAASHRQQSMVLVPVDTPGVTVARMLPVFGYQDQEGHGEVIFEDVRVPRTNLIGEEGGGFAIAQARLGPGRIHHCMRLIGMAEQALELMVRRAASRTAFGRLLAEQGIVQQQIAESRVELEQARLLTLKAAWLMDTQGNKAARTEISAIKVVAPRIACAIIDRAIQVHGGAGVSEDFPLASLYAHARTLRLADGPDEVHLMTLARRELRRVAAG